LIGELGSVETLLYIGIWGCFLGLMMVLYGWRIRYLIFPLIILALIVPLPPFVNRMLTFQLKLAASSIATAMLRLSGVSVFQDGNIIDLGVTQLQVVDACNGLRRRIIIFSADRESG
jgi:exosortase